MTKVKIPKGWRKLKSGELIKSSDLVFAGGNKSNIGHYMPTISGGEKVNAVNFTKCLYIRRITRKAK